MQCEEILVVLGDQYEASFGGHEQDAGIVRTGKAQRPHMMRRMTVPGEPFAQTGCDVFVDQERRHALA